MWPVNGCKLIMLVAAACVLCRPFHLGFGIFFDQFLSSDFRSCIITLPRVLAECRNMRQNQDIFMLYLHAVYLC